MFDSGSTFERWQLFELENLFRGSLLTMGIVKNNPELVRQGLEQGESPNERYTYEEDNDSIIVPNPVYTITPIVQAAVMGSLPISELLVKHGADVNLCQSNGESALANAANRGNVELTSFLLEHGADPNLRKSFGTPLALADGVAVMRVLLEHGADPNIPDGDGDLPIIGSIDANNLDEIELLVRHGTDLGYVNKQGETPVDRAKRRGNFDSVVALLKLQNKAALIPVPPRRKNQLRLVSCLSCRRHARREISKRRSRFWIPAPIRTREAPTVERPCFTARKSLLFAFSNIAVQM